jgi:hypothetical protein
MADLKVSAVVFQEGDWWVIQCLEYDIATQVRHLTEIPQQFRSLLRAQIEANAECGVPPFHGFSRAPRRFWEMFEGARTIVDDPRIEARLAA